MNEIWKTAVYEGEIYEGLYKVSNWGRILSLDYRNTGKPGLMTPRKRKKDGYFQVNLRKNGETKTCYVHRLVAQTFLPNPENKPCVNHKIEGKKGKTMNMVFFNEDGSVDEKRTTIEWCTYEENNNYATRNERAGKAISKANTNGKLSKPVLQLSLSGDLIREWPSIGECVRNGFDRGAVWRCCRGELPHYKGFRFMYADDYREKQFRELGYVPLF